MSTEQHHTIRVHGPYREEQPDGTVRYRVVLAQPGRAGKRRSRVFADEQSAQAYIDKARQATSGQTCRDLIQAYLTKKSALKKNSPRSISTLADRLYGLIKPMQGGPITDLTPAKAATLYTAYAATRAVDTHRNALANAREWGKWLTAEGHLKVNPWLAVEAVGQRSQGKDQMRLDEARVFWRYVRQHLDQDHCLAVAVALLCGLRAGEIIRLVSRDIDDNGGIIWVNRGKSKNARRHLRVPSALRRPLKARADGANGDRLFPWHRRWVLNATKRIARAAGLADWKRATAHALRGLHATLRVEFGDVQRELGHRVGDSVTERHYLQPGTTDRATINRVTEELDDDEHQPT